MNRVHATEIVVSVPGDPVPWAGKQTNRKTGNRFIPGRQADATGRVLAAAGKRFEEHGPLPAGTPLSLDCEFFIRRPKGHYGTGRNAGTIKPAFVDAEPTGRPDLSNLVKLIEDGIVLAGLVPDDDQVVAISARKVYTGSREEQPRSVARLRAL